MQAMFIRNRAVISAVLFGFILTIGMLNWLQSIIFHSCGYNSILCDARDRFLPIIFVGGFPRSGTTLMRVLLDTHPEIRCGQETHVIPKLLLHVGQYNLREKTRLDAAGVTEEVLDSAVASFILQVIKGHGVPANRLCNKDPLSLRNMTYLVKLFPNSKFVLMVRDGRAVVHSLMSRKINIRGIKNHSYEHLLNTWSETVSAMARQCSSLIPRQCIFVHYEHLVLFPAQTMKRVMRFVGVDWNDKILHHEQQIGTPMGPVVSRYR
jgi:protein-tyrosine sulfotransferase